MRWWAAPLLAGLAGLCALSPAGADGSWGGSVGGTTDYIFHSLSQSDGDPAVQGDLHYLLPWGASNSEAFAGLWSSTISRSETGGSFEMNAYAGGTVLVSSGSSATLTYVRYAYPDDRGRPRYDYDELSGTWAYHDQVFLSAAWTPDTASYSERGVGRCCRRLAYDLALHHGLGRAWTASAGIGYDQLARFTGYGYGNAGLAYAAGPFQFDVSYFAVQPRIERIYGETVAGRRWVGTVVWRF